MAKAVFVLALEPGSGKSIIALGLMEALSRISDKVGYFRPVIADRSDPDPTVELLRRRYKLSQSYGESFGLTGSDTKDIGDMSDAEIDEILATILGRYHALADIRDVVLVEGTDFESPNPGYELELNVAMAEHLKAPVVLVINAHGRRTSQIKVALKSAIQALEGKQLRLLALAINRVDDERVQSLRETLEVGDTPIWVLPEKPSLQRPSLHQVSTDLRTVILTGDAASLDREVTGVNVAAMTLVNLLDRLQDGTLMITPGDRADMLLAAAVTRISDQSPSVSGVVVTGGITPDPRILSFLEGLGDDVTPIMTTSMDTYEAANRVAHLTPETRFGDDRRIAGTLGLFEAAADTTPVIEHLDLPTPTSLTPTMFENRMVSAARREPRTLVLPDGNDDRVLRAADQVLRRGICDLILLGNEETLRERARALGLNIASARVIDPETDELRSEMADLLVRLRAHKGMAPALAYDAVADETVFGTLLVRAGHADGLVGGADRTTTETLRPAFQLIRNNDDVSIASSVNFMCRSDRVLLFGDCAVNPEPDATQLADIAVSAADTAAQFGIDPRIALLGNPGGLAGDGPSLKKVTDAVELVKQRRPDLPVDGPIDYDSAVVPEAAASRFPDSPVAGRATILVFPDLATGASVFESVRRSARAVTMGPILQGLRKPVNDLPDECTVKEIIQTITITAIQAQNVAG